MNPAQFPVATETGLPVQYRLEALMKEFSAEGRWECIFLFSSEGLLMAKSGESVPYGEENLLEFSFSMIQTMSLLGESVPVKEVWIRGRERKAMVFRYFAAWGESMVLAAVVSGRKGYRKALNEIIRQIQNAAQSP